MILVTIIGFFPSYTTFIFAGGSDGLMDMISVNSFFQTSIILIFGAILIVNKSKLRKYTYFLLMLVFLLWSLSGRMIALFPDGRLSSGWFYIETNRINICKDEIDCDKIFYYETEIEKLPLWRIKIKNKRTDNVVFIGPMVWKKTIELFKKKFPRSL
jgi:hypothetical protein